MATTPLRRALGYANVLFRYRWLIVVAPILAFAASVLRHIGDARSYTSHAKFMTQATTPRAPSSGVAAQLGINMGSTGDASLSPDFYSELVKTRPILERAVDQGTFVQQLGGNRERAATTLGNAVSTSISPKTGIVTLEVRASNPKLAQALAAEMLRQLDEFNRLRRQSRVRAERQFAEARLAEAATDLRAAEEALTGFLTRNRGFDRSPELTFDQERLTREVTRRQQLYASVAQGLEQAKMDEVRDTPVITVIEPPDLPEVPNPRYLRDRAVLAAMVGLVLALLLVLVIEALRGSRIAETPEFEQLRQQGRAFVREALNPIGAARRFFS